MSAPAVPFLTCHNVEPGVQLPGSVPKPEAGCDTSSSEVLGAPLRSVLYTLITTFTMERGFYFLDYKPVFLY